MMYGDGKSDRPIVPAKTPNGAEPEKAEEALEGRGLVKGNLLQCNMFRTQSRATMCRALK